MNDWVCTDRFYDEYSYSGRAKVRRNRPVDRENKIGNVTYMDRDEYSWSTTKSSGTAPTLSSAMFRALSNL